MARAMDFQEEEEEEESKKQVVRTKSSKMSPRHAFLDSDLPNENVVVEEVYSPGLFYVRRLKFDLQLRQLEQDLAKAADRGRQEGDDLEVAEGEFCIGRVPAGDGETACYKRVMVEGLEEEEDGGTVLEVQLMDYGIKERLSRSRLFPIPPELVGRLPFQAVECKLFNLRPVSGGEQEAWDRESGDFFFNAISEGDAAKRLTAIVCGKSPSRITTGYWKPISCASTLVVALS